MGKKTPDWRALVARAEQGDTRALPALRAWLDANPEVWQSTGDLARQCQQSLIHAMSGKDNLSLPEVYQRKLAQMRQELGWQTASPVEWLVIERLLTCWLHVHYMEAVYVQNLAAIPVQAQDSYQRRISRAHARFLASVRELVRVRTMLAAVVPSRPLEVLPQAVYPIASPGQRNGHGQAPTRHS